MIVDFSEFEAGAKKYLELCKNQEIIIARNDLPVARLLGINESDKLVRIIPANIDETAEKDERLERQ